MQTEPRVSGSPGARRPRRSRDPGLGREWAKGKGRWVGLGRWPGRQGSPRDTNLVRVNPCAQKGAAPLLGRVGAAAVTALRPEDALPNRP